MGPGALFCFMSISGKHFLSFLDHGDLSSLNPAARGDQNLVFISMEINSIVTGSFGLPGFFVWSHSGLTIGKRRGYFELHGIEVHGYMRQNVPGYFHSCVRPLLLWTCLKVVKNKLETRRHRDFCAAAPLFFGTLTFCLLTVFSLPRAQLPFSHELSSFAAVVPLHLLKSLSFTPKVGELFLPLQKTVFPPLVLIGSGGTYFHSFLGAVSPGLHFFLRAAGNRHSMDYTILISKQKREETEDRIYRHLPGGGAGEQLKHELREANCAPRGMDSPCPILRGAFSLHDKPEFKEISHASNIN